MADALRWLAVSARRHRRYGAAAARWRAILAVPGCPHHLTREATDALAIHHEHRARDLAAARMFALRSLEMDGSGGRRAADETVRHRLARIERKIVSERRSLFSSPLPPLPPFSGSRTSAPRTSS